MPTRDQVQHLLDQGHDYSEIASRLGMPPGQVYLIGTGMPADGSDTYTDAERQRPGVLPTARGSSTLQLTTGSARRDPLGHLPRRHAVGRGSEVHRHPATRTNQGHPMNLTSRRASRRMTALWAALRIGLGVAALIKPRLASQAWVGPDASRGLTAVVLGRAAGGRDVALGAGAVASAVAGAPLTPWVLAGGGADAVDAAATWLGGPGLPRWRRILVTAVSAGSALTAVFLATRVDRRLVTGGVRERTVW